LYIISSGTHIVNNFFQKVSKKFNFFQSLTFKRD